MDRNKLIEDNLPLVYFVILKKCGINGYDDRFDDLFQCGCIGLILAADAYDESKEKFSTFACKCIYNELVRYFRQEKKYHSIPTVSLSKVIYGHEDGVLTIEDTISYEDDTRVFDDTEIKIIDEFNKMDFPHKDIYLDRLKGMKLKEIAEKYHVTHQYVGWLILKIEDMLRNKFKKYI